MSKNGNIKRYEIVQWAKIQTDIKQYNRQKNKQTSRSSITFLLSIIKEKQIHLTQKKRCGIKTKSQLFNYLALILPKAQSVINNTKKDIPDSSRKSRNESNIEIPCLLLRVSEEKKTHFFRNFQPIFFSAAIK